MPSPSVNGSPEPLLGFLPAEQFHKVLEAVLAEEVKGARGRALGGSQVDEEQHQQDHEEQRDQQVPAGRQDVVPLGLV